MRVYGKKEEIVSADYLVSGYCNKCGQETDLTNYWSYDLHQIVIGFGYGSKHDGDHWVFDLCEKCIEEFTSSFKYPPEKL